MSSRKKVLIKLTDDQRNKIKAELDKDVTHVIFQLIGGSHLVVDASDVLDNEDGRL